MVEDSFHIPKHPSAPPPEVPTAPMAGEAEIPRPAPQVRRDEESGAQLKQWRGPETTERARGSTDFSGRRPIEPRDQKKISKTSEALRNYMSFQDGRGVSADVLLATAAMMAQLPGRRKEKKKRIRDLYLKWARETSTVLITKVIRTFRR